MIPYIFLTLGTIMGLVVFARPTIGIYLLAFISLILAGFIQYFIPSLKYIMWVAPVISFFLIFSAFSGKRSAGRLPKSFKWIVLFILAGVLSLASNLHYLEEFFTDAKNYYMFLSIPFLAVFIKLDERWLKLTGTVVLLAAFIQAPISLFQHFFMVNYSSRLAGADSIVGTFGGSAISGGNSGAQTAFLVVMIAWVMVRYFFNEIRVEKLILYSGILLIPILLNETKIFFIYMPTIIVFLAYIHIRTNTRKVLVVLFLGVAFIVSVLVYYFLYVQQGDLKYKDKTISSYIERTIIGNAVREKAQNSEALGRIATYPYWWKNNAINVDPISMLFGHGLGASKNAGIVRGHLQKESKYIGKSIAITGIAKLLWETGLFGTFVYMAMFISVFFGAGKLRRRRSTEKYEKMLLETIQVSTIILVGGLFYDSYLFRNQALNFMAMATVAYYLYLEKLSKVKKNVDN